MNPQPSACERGLPAALCEQVFIAVQPNLYINRTKQFSASVGIVCRPPSLTGHAYNMEHSHDSVIFWCLWVNGFNSPTVSYSSSRSNCTASPLSGASSQNGLVQITLHPAHEAITNIPPEREPISHAFTISTWGNGALRLLDLIVLLYCAP